MVCHAVHRCCNQCFGCNHFAAFHRGNKWEYDPNTLRRDLKLVNRLGILVGELHLCGGEPLMHSDIEACIRACEKFPAQLWLKTNGMMLLQQSQSFWSLLRDTKFHLQVTNYTLTNDRIDKIRRTAAGYGVPLRIGKPDRWHLRFQNTQRNYQHALQAFRDCDYHPYKYLHDGALYRCSIDAYAAPFFKARLGKWRDNALRLDDAEFAKKYHKWCDTATGNCEICCTKAERQVGVPWRRITDKEIKEGVNS